MFIVYVIKQFKSIVEGQGMKMGNYFQYRLLLRWKKRWIRNQRVMNILLDKKSYANRLIFKMYSRNGNLSIVMGVMVGAKDGLRRQLHKSKNIININVHNLR